MRTSSLSGRRAALGHDEDGHFGCGVVDAVNDAVLAKSHPPIVGASHELLGACGARIVG